MTLRAETIQARTRDADDSTGDSNSNGQPSRITPSAHSGDALSRQKQEQTAGELIAQPGGGVRGELAAVGERAAAEQHRVVRRQLDRAGRQVSDAECGNAGRSADPPETLRSEGTTGRDLRPWCLLALRATLRGERSSDGGGEADDYEDTRSRPGPTGAQP